MYVKSSALNTKQQKAAKLASARWGAGYEGEEVIPHPVCKRKYQPYKNGELQYGCHFHHDTRLKRIQRHGLREGWESFQQWQHVKVDHLSQNGAETREEVKPVPHSKSKGSSKRKRTRTH